MGSVPPEHRAVWQRLEAKTGIVPELYERGGLSGGEQGLDQCLQVHMLRALTDNAEPHIAVLLTGDGAGYDDGVGFHADMERMQEAGWGIEVLSWEQSCRRTLREWATDKGCFVSLDAYYDAITFLEGTRRAVALNMATRPHAAVRPGPAAVAVFRASVASESQIQALKAELAALKEVQSERGRGRGNFLKRQARQGGGSPR